jgi:hypothetical protein
MPPDRDSGAAHRDGDQVVEAQCHHCGPARRRLPQDDYTILTPLQVPPSTLAPRMEEADTPPGPRIAPMDLLACAHEFISICGGTSRESSTWRTKRSTSGGCGPTMSIAVSSAVAASKTAAAYERWAAAIW